MKLRAAIWKARAQMETATDARNQAIVALAQIGISYRHIAEVSGLSHPTISEIVRRAHVRQGASL